MKTAVADSAAAPGATGFAAPSARRLGRFVLLHEIGRGAQATPTPNTNRGPQFAGTETAVEPGCAMRRYALADARSDLPEWRDHAGEPLRNGS